MVEVFQYPWCGTCKKALAWLDAAGVAYHARDIVAHPPSLAQLKKALKLSGLPVGKLFNTSGQSYRQGGFKQKLVTMSDAEALAALARDGKLIKRPLIFGDGFVRLPAERVHAAPGVTKTGALGAGGPPLQRGSGAGGASTPSNGSAPTPTESGESGGIIAGGGPP